MPPPTPPDFVAPPPVAADVGIVGALGIEFSPFLAKLGRVRRYQANRVQVIEGELRGRLVVVALNGMGRPSAQRAAEALLAGHRPRWIVSAGFAGALDPTLRRNDVVLPREVVNAEGARFTIDLGLPDGSERSGLRTGRLLTSDAIAATAAAKAELRRQHGADLVDMETSAVAALCAERGVRFLSVRVVSDEAANDLPPEASAILGESGGLRLGATVGVLWKRPGSIKDLLTLRTHANEAAAALAHFLAGALDQLG